MPYTIRSLVLNRSWYTIYNICNIYYEIYGFLCVRVSCVTRTRVQLVHLNALADIFKVYLYKSGTFQRNVLTTIFFGIDRYNSYAVKKRSSRF